MKSSNDMFTYFAHLMFLGGAIVFGVLALIAGVAAFWLGPVALGLALSFGGGMLALGLAAYRTR